MNEPSGAEGPVHRSLTENHDPPETEPRAAPPLVAEPPPHRFSHAWRALRHRNFRLFFSGQSISLIGTWMTRIATAWLVYRLTHSALLLGTVSFVGQIPVFLLAPVAGVWVDRLNRRTVLLWTQALAMVQSLLLAGLTLTHIIHLPELMVLAAFQGVINAFDMPARQSFMVQMVESREDLQNAIAINSSMANLARLLGPSLAGLIIALSNEGYCFLIDGLSYVAVIVSLLMMRMVATARTESKATMGEQLREGWAYVSRFVPIRSILLLFAILSLMGWPFVVLMPIFAVKVFKGGPNTLGLLMGAVGVGALLSALVLVARRSPRGLTRVIPLAAVLFGAGLVAFGFSRAMWVSMLLMLVTGYGMMQGLTASNTVIQTLADEKMRGRVMSYYTVAFVGMAPFGSLLAGWMAHHIGAARTVQIDGVVCILAAGWFCTQLPAIRRQMRPIYEELGIVSRRN